MKNKTCTPEPRILKPEFLLPMSAKAVDKLPEGNQWAYEIKWDGYRVEAIKHLDQVRLFSRKARDPTTDFPEVRRTVETVKAKSAAIDGEIVVLDEQGRPSFQNLQRRSRRMGPIVYYAFDLLNLNGFDLTGLPLSQRKEKLRAILHGSKVLFSENIEGDLDVIIEQVQKLELEGIVAKRQDSRYLPGKSDGWFKLQLKRQQEFVIGGYTRKPQLRLRGGGCVRPRKAQVQRQSESRVQPFQPSRVASLDAPFRNFSLSIYRSPHRESRPLG
jgi:bifunctional non-homologous end joining protein LigD